MSRRLALATLLAASLCLPAHAEVPLDGPDWFAEPYAYALVDQDLRGAFSEFGHNLGLIVVLSEKVRGKARSPLRSDTAGDFITRLCASNGLGWYFDGNILYINTDDEVATRLIHRRPGLDPQALHEYLAELDVKGPQLSLRQGAGGDELYVSGPPAYLSMIQQHLDAQPQPAAEQARAPAPVAQARGIRVFRGASVSDH
ncbi:type III secretion protein [Pseudomonas entomophila]|uniref:type III secretion protein n=1 Tax=Pseudomonas entomophila TaxID=312306 RepID=UPI0023D8C65A|nr:type III secretion protein [Pseudomonas entomophila]MDF0733064.1 type III secretion protein [Pseudomonas entomophila]